MKLLSAFAALLMALQVAAAASSDGHQQHSGFVKVKRNVAGHPAPEHKAYRLGHIVKKRDLEGLLIQHSDLLKEFENATNAYKKADIAEQLRDVQGKIMAHPDAKKVFGASAQQGREGTSAAAARAEESGSEHEYEAATADHRPLTHEQLENVIAWHDVGLSGHRKELDQLIEANKDLKDKIKSQGRWNKALAGASLASVATGTTVAFTSMAAQNEDKKALNNHADIINNLQAEVARLKAQTPSAPGTRAGVAGVGTPGVPATQGAATNGALIS